MRRATQPSTGDLDDLRLPRSAPRRFWSQAILFAACVLLANGLVGERGLLERVRARRNYAEAAEGLARLRQQNFRLRETVHNLRTDPATIEAVAREELGLIRRGEILVSVRNLKR